MHPYVRRCSQPGCLATAVMCPANPSAASWLATAVPTASANARVKHTKHKPGPYQGRCIWRACPSRAAWCRSQRSKRRRPPRLEFQEAGPLRDLGSTDFTTSDGSITWFSGGPSVALKAVACRLVGEDALDRVTRPGVSGCRARLASDGPAMGAPSPLGITPECDGVAHPVCIPSTCVAVRLRPAASGI